MGETKEVQLHQGVKLARLVTATLAGLFFFVLLAQLILFTEIQIDFNTGTDAQQIASISVKKGTEFELPTPLKPGSCFLGWSLSPDGEILTTSKGLLRNTTLYAVWDGAEKYAVLSVNGIKHKEINIFDTRIDGLTPAELSQDWRVLDDYAEDNLNRVLYSISGTKSVMVDPNNNFSRFLGWKYLNAHRSFNELRFNADTNGKIGEWILIERDADGNETKTIISETNKFYPPNYRTVFSAILEYRTMDIQFYHKGDNTSYQTVTIQMGEELKLPKYDNPKNPYVPFSHWEIRIGDINKEVNAEQTPELADLLGKIKTRYQAGEAITLDPLWYYFGSELISSDGSANLVVILEMHAVHWDSLAVPQYTVQPFTDLSAGETYIDVTDIGYDQLSLTKPVSFEDDCIWFFDDDRIFSYTFYDHDGLYHEIKTMDLQDNLAGGIRLDYKTTFLEQEIYFNSDWAINIAVNYQSSKERVVVRFNYGDKLYSLPNYHYCQTTEIYEDIREIGSSLVLLTGEKYLKTDHIFTGWRLVGDDTERLYCAGETYKIPNFNTSNTVPVVEFEAVWHLQRLLFDFDFMGGNWKDDIGPDFTLMKGAFNDRVQIVKDVPVRFGYDFIGWSLDTNVYTDESELLQPGQVIDVGAKIQVLYAQWQPKRIRVLFYGKEINGSWRQRKRTNEDFYTQKQLRAGGYIELPFIKDTDWSTFNGWLIGGKVVDAYEIQQLTTNTLSELEIRETEDSQGTILEVRIYADETKNTVDLVYDFNVAVSDNETIKINIDQNQLQNVLVQGNLFSAYYPFSLVKKNFDTNGRQFNGWSYVVNGSSERISITDDTIVPVGVKKITIYGDFSEVKSFRIRYLNFNGEYFSESETTNNYGGVLPLIDSDNLGSLPKAHDEWGVFTGWALEQDHVAGNPDIIFEADASKNPQLKLSNQDNTATSPYLINIDRYAEQVSGNSYVLKLYAVYSTNYVQLAYTYLKNGDNGNTILRLPVYSNGNFEKTVYGGSTIGFNSSNFLSYGNSVLDDSTLDVANGKNFVGWQAELPEGVDYEVKTYFENKIWFPGEFLPAIDFNIRFIPIRLSQKNSVQDYKVGEKTYRILALSSGKNNIVINEKIDVVALPRGTYTISEGGIKILSDQEVHVVVSADNNSQITIDPRAIHCDSLKEFYVGDNLIINGSPVIGAEFKAYRIQKGYRLMDENGVPTEIQNYSVKYNFESCAKGLLISKDNKVLYGVPSHVALSSDEILEYLTEIKINQINSYAFADINNLDVINLGFDINNFQEISINENAIYNGSVTHVILPKYNGSSRLVNPRVLAGALTNLRKVSFGDLNTFNTGYAFVDSGFVYYVDNLTQPTAKTHVMYVLPNAKLESLKFTTHNLHFEDTVSIIEPCALMGRDWNQIKSIMIENDQIDVRNLVKTIEKDIPVFVSVQNKYKKFYSDPRIQSYIKTFEFICHNSDSVYSKKEIEFSYGETFNVFSAQENDYGFYFDKTWCQFLGWKVSGNSKISRVGEVYKVGISEVIKGDKFTVQFDASDSDCWLNFPVQFYVFDGKNNVPYIPEVFYDSRNLEYLIKDLIKYNDYLDEIYLPGVDQSFISTDGATYQFIGWGTSQTNPSHLDTLLWNKIDTQYRILPNKTLHTGLDAGNSRVDGIYRYYALYEKVTPNMEYQLLDNNTFAITGLTQANITSLNIPFAKYNDGYMTPITKINDNVFESINSASGLTEISIGGAISEIGKNAFSGVNSKEIYFAHRGREIRYNHQDTPVGKLTIGQEAFARNQNVKKLILPSALETLHDRAFQACTDLTNVSFDTSLPSLTNIGNFVFRDNQSMTSNEVIRLLTEDNDYLKRFSYVGDGIFMNSGIANLVTSDGKPTNKIVWRDKLLHVFYLNLPGFNDLTFYEKEIGGYAFVNVGNNQDSNVEITLRFYNANTIIYADAFSYLHTNVNKIYLKEDLSNSININNVDIKAFDDSIKHKVSVYTDNPKTWGETFHEVRDAGFVNFS